MVTTAISPAPDQQPEPVAKIGAMGRVTGVLFSPGETFKDIVQKPNWFLPLAILTVFSLVACYFLIPKVDWREFNRKQIESSSFSKNLPEDQKQVAIERNVKFAAPFTYGIGLLAPIIFILIVTLIYWGSFNVFKGAGLRFGTSFAITVYAWLPAVIGAILAIVILILKQPGDADPQRIAATSLGFFLSGDSPKWLIALGTSVDLLWFWTLALLAIGYAAANPRKITKSSAYSLVFGMWMLWVVIKVALAALF